VSLCEAQGEHRETGSREFSVRKITCDQVPLLVQIEKQSVWTVFKFPSPPKADFIEGWSLPYFSLGVDGVEVFCPPFFNPPWVEGEAVTVVFIREWLEADRV